MGDYTQRNAAVIEEILAIIRSDEENDVIAERLQDYHENDIADALEFLTRQERALLYYILGTEQSAEVLSYSEEAAEYLSEVLPQKAADIIEDMDADDAVDILEDVEPETRENIISLIDDQSVFLQCVHTQPPVLRFHCICGVPFFTTSACIKAFVFHT